MPQTKSKKKQVNALKKHEHEMQFKDDEQEYARIVKKLGGYRMICQCYDGIERTCKTRGSLRRCPILEGDIVLVSLREFQDCKGDIINHYSASQVRLLQKQGHIPVTDTNEEEDTGTGFVFDYGNEDEINIDSI